MRAFTLSLILVLSAVVAAPQARKTPAPAAPTLLYVGTWPNKIQVIDEAQEKVIDQITLETGVPQRLLLSTDKKKLFVRTTKDAGFEVVDLTTRKVTEHFTLNAPDRRVWLSDIAPDPKDSVLYTAFFTAVKKQDRFEIEKPKFGIIDLAQKKISKTVDFPKEESNIFSMFGGYRVSPDGKFLYIFRDNIYIYDTADFKQVDKIELAKPTYPWMESLNIGPGDDPNDEPGIVTSVFNSTDPIVHRTVFGIARVDLSKRTFDFTPVGPTTTNGMTGLRLTPDRKTGYTVAFIGQAPNRRTEFWMFDMTSRRLVNRVEFPSRTRFNFSLSGDGKLLYIFGAGPTMEVWDAATLKLRKVIDVSADMTTNLVVVVPHPS